MPRKKKLYDVKLGKSVEAMVAAGVTQMKIVELLPDIVRADLDRKKGLYRKDWVRGLSLVSTPIINTYLKMAGSGKCWGATRYFLTTHLGIVENYVKEALTGNPIDKISIFSDNGRADIE